MQKNGNSADGTEANEIATAFVNARLAGQSLETYPGSPPESLDAAYDIQNRAIGLWPDEIAGWKVGRIVGEAEILFGTDRLAGPIFEPTVKFRDGTPAIMPVFKDGFAAVEGEIIIIVGEDAPAEKTSWSTEDAAAMIGSIHAGVEIASSPFAGINDLGPLVTISDFGNNYGVIIGGEIPNWRGYDPASWRCRTLIDGELVGEDTPAAIPGGPVESLRFLLENTARRGLPLKQGMAVCTGAVTGIHQARAGQTASVIFEGTSEIRCELVEQSPVKTRTFFSWLNAAVACAALFVWAADDLHAKSPAGPPQIGASLNAKEDVAITDVPADVMAVARAARPDLTFQEAEKERRNGVTYYDIEGVTSDGAEIELDIMQTETGWRVVEVQRDITLDETPEAVRTALFAGAPGIEPARIIESDQGNGVIIYEFFTRAGDGREKKYEVKLEGGTAEFLEKEWLH